MKRFITYWVLGKKVYEILDPSATAIVVRSFWIVTLILFSPALLFFLCKHKFNIWNVFIIKMTADMYLKMSAVYFGAIWAVFTSLRNEFVSKYNRLLDYMEGNISVESVCKGHIEGFSVNRIDQAGLNFIEDALVYGLQSHSTFKNTFRWIVGALISNSLNHVIYFRKEIENLPNFSAFKSKMSAQDIEKCIVFYNSCCEFDALEKVFVSIDTPVFIRKNHSRLDSGHNRIAILNRKYRSMQIK